MREWLSCSFLTSVRVPWKGEACTGLVSEPSRLGFWHLAGLC